VTGGRDSPKSGTDGSPGGAGRQPIRFIDEAQMSATYQTRVRKSSLAIARGQDQAFALGRLETASCQRFRCRAPAGIVKPPKAALISIATCAVMSAIV
jgi:hypothetical protein